MDRERLTPINIIFQSQQSENIGLVIILDDSFAPLISVY